MRYAFIAALLIGCGEKAEDTAVEEMEEVVEEATPVEGEGEEEVQSDECTDGDIEDREGVTYICEDGIWVVYSNDPADSIDD